MKPDKLDNTPNHWSRDPVKKALVMAKISKHLQPNYWKSRKRDPAVIKALIKGKDEWIKNNPEEYKESRKRAAEKITGEKHYLWKGGLSSENQKVRQSDEMIDWAKAVKKRDNYKCVKCGGHDKFLASDHIKPFSTHPELRFDLSNGQTLCGKCHTIKTRKDMKFTNKYTGVSYAKERPGTKKWRAYINGRSLGYFANVLDAVKARQEAETNLI